jgi:hypothetical protein
MMDPITTSYVIEPKVDDAALEAVRPRQELADVLVRSTS